MEMGSQFEGIIPEASKVEIEEIINEDGILCLILSNLTLKEAVRTSVLSTRWRHIWTHLTKFEFDPITVLDSHIRPGDWIAAYPESREKGKKDKFIRSVDSVLHQLQGAKLNIFRVQYFLRTRHSLHLNSWVRFAIESKVKEFSLHLFSTDLNKLYDFPSQLLGPSSSIEILSLGFCSLKLPPGKVDGLSRLKVLDLINVDINDEDLNCILSSCSRTLTNLILCYIWRLASISAPYHLIHLKNLDVLNCYDLSKVEINAVNLVKLTYYGLPIDFRIEQSLRLIYAEIRFTPGETKNNLDFYLTNLSSSLPRLQSLTFTFNVRFVSEVSTRKGSSRFFHLKRLDLEWVFSQMNLHHLITVLDVAPFLEELKLCLKHGCMRSPKGIKSSLQTPNTPNQYIEMLSRPPHTHLKEIRISGFYFGTWQNDIAVYLLRNATELKSIIIDRGPETSRSVSKEVYEIGRQILYKEVRANVLLVFSRFEAQLY